MVSQDLQHLLPALSLGRLQVRYWAFQGHPVFYRTTDMQSVIELISHWQDQLSHH